MLIYTNTSILQYIGDTYIVGKSPKKAVCRCIFLTIWHCILMN